MDEPIEVALTTRQAMLIAELLAVSQHPELIPVLDVLERGIALRVKQQA